MIAPCYFIDIHTQHDFMAEGAEALGGVEEIKPNLKKLTQHAFKHRIPIISAVEAYGEKDFAGSRRKAYCVRGTKGYRKIEETSLKKKILLKKELLSARAYRNLLDEYPQIILETTGLDFFSNPHALEILQNTEIRNCIVYGIGLDYGLQLAVTRLLQEGFQVWIPVDAVWSINEKNREQSLIELRKLGAHMWNTNFILENTSIAQNDKNLRNSDTITQLKISKVKTYLNSKLKN